MKRTLFQIVNLLMVCVVLLSSTGFGLVEHSCQMRGKKKTMVMAFSQPQPPLGCAANGQPMPPKKTAVQKTQCCQDQSSYANVDPQSSLSQFIAKFFKVVTEAVLAGVAAVVACLVEWIFDRESSSLQLVGLVPAPSGRDILTFVCTLLL